MAKRRNMIRGIRRHLWAMLPDNWTACEQAEELLQRSEAALGDWKARNPKDKKDFEALWKLVLRFKERLAA